MNNYLIDTHVLLWMAQEPGNIPFAAKSILGSESKIFLSLVSIWEIAIKVKIQKLDIQMDISDFVESSIQNHRLELLPISLQYIYYIQQLALYHKDPFDRLLIVQSLTNGIPIVSADEKFNLYDVSRIWK